MDPAAPQTSLQDQFVEEAIPVGLPWRLLISGAVILGLTILIAFGLEYGYKPYLTDQVTAVDAQFSSLTKNFSEQDQKKIVTTYSQLANLKTILEKRTAVNGAFKFLEEQTIPSVYYTDAVMNGEEIKLTLKGFVPTLTELSQQIAVFEKNKDVRSVILDNVGLQAGGAVFSLTLQFNAETFK
jgi:hypothetical protein